MKFCQDCGDKLAGRKDKKFCNDYCRSHFNNQNNSIKNASMKDINNILKRNKGILERLYHTNICVFSRQTLIIAGFDFNFFTHTVSGKNGEVYNCCYSFGYTLTNKNEFKIDVFTG